MTMIMNKDDYVVMVTALIMTTTTTIIVIVNIGLISVFIRHLLHLLNFPMISGSHRYSRSV